MGRYRNPVLPGCHPDPSICRFGDDYLLVTSTFEYLPGLPVHRSSDLVHWELVGHVVHDELDYAGIPASRGLFAPTIRAHAGRLYVVCTHMESTGRGGHFAMTATDPAGPWTGPVWLEGTSGIDPSLTFDGDRVWLCGTRLAEPGQWHHQTEAWLQELDPATLQPIGDERVLWHGALENAVWAEGPHLLARPGGGWMLLAAEGGTDRDHAVVVAYADEITGPYLGDPANPRLSHRDLGERIDIVAVGHADLVEAVDGRTWSVMLATRTRDGVSSLLGRQTHLVPVEWEDRRPLFAPGVGRVQLEVDAEGVPDGPADAEATPAPEGPLDLAWNGVRTLPSGVAEEAGDGRVVLRASSVEPGDGGAPAFLGRRLPAHQAIVRARVTPADSGRAGLLLRLSDAAYLELSVDSAGTARAVRSADGRVDELAVVERAATGEAEVEIAVDWFTATVAVDGRRLATVDVARLSPDHAGEFVGVWAGPFAVGPGQASVRDAVVAATPASV